MDFLNVFSIAGLFFLFFAALLGLVARQESLNIWQPRVSNQYYHDVRWAIRLAWIGSMFLIIGISLAF